MREQVECHVIQPDIYPCLTTAEGISDSPVFGIAGVGPISDDTRHPSEYQVA